MFNCKELRIEDFEAVAKALTSPQTGKTEIQMDMFAKKFLKQARELGSNDPVIYERLTKLYFQKGSYDKAGLEVEKFKSLAPNSDVANELFLKVYRVGDTPITDNAIGIALGLVKKPKYNETANNILLKGAKSIGYKRRNLGDFAHQSIFTPVHGKYYSRIKVDNRKAMATHFYDSIQRYVKNMEPNSLKSPYDLLEMQPIKDSIVALAVMENVEMNNMKKLCNAYLSSLGLIAEKVIEKDTVTRIQCNNLPPA